MVCILRIVDAYGGGKIQNNSLAVLPFSQNFRWNDNIFFLIIRFSNVGRPTCTKYIYWYPNANVFSETYFWSNSRLVSLWKYSDCQNGLLAIRLGSGVKPKIRKFSVRENFSYRLTFIDCFTWCSEFVLAYDIFVDTLAFSFASEFLNDQPGQFESQLFRSFCGLLGMKRLRTCTTYFLSSLRECNRWETTDETNSGFFLKIFKIIGKLYHRLNKLFKIDCSYRLISLNRYIVRLVNVAFVFYSKVARYLFVLMFVLVLLRRKGVAFIFQSLAKIWTFLLYFKFSLCQILLLFLEYSTT